jgi:hypothetical protein
MAQQPSFQPILNPSGYQAQPNANRLAGASKGMSSGLTALSRIAELGGPAMDAYQSFKTSDIREKIQADLEPLLEEAMGGSPSFQGELESNVAMNQEILNTLPSVPGPEDPEVLNTFISGVEKNINSDIQRLSRAKEQRRMSPYEFEQRSLAIARRYLSDNPGLRREILSTISNTFQDQGIIERLKFDESIVSNQQAVYEAEAKDIQQNFEKWNIPDSPYRTPNGTYDVPRARAIIDLYRKDEAKWNEFTRNREYSQAASEDDLKYIESSGLPYELVHGATITNMSDLSNIFSGSVEDFPKAKLQASAYLTQSLVNFRNNPRIRSYMSSPVVKEAADFYEKQITALTASMESFNSLEDFNKYTSNMKTILENKEQVKMMNRLNTAELNLALKVGGIANLTNTANGVKFLSDLVIVGQDILVNAKVNDNRAFTTLPNSSNTTMGLFFDQAAKDSANGLEGSSGLLNKVVTSFIGGIEDPRITKNPQEQFTRLDDFIRRAGNANNKDSFAELDGEARTKFQTALDVYNEQINVNLSDYLSKTDRDITININPKTGRLIVSGADAEFNQTFTARIDQALGAYANFRGQPASEVWVDFYEENFSNVLSGETPQVVKPRNNPLNLKKPDASGFQEYETIEQGIQGAANQLMRYYEGKGVAKTPRRTVKDIIDLWRPASDRRGEKDISQEDYINTVSSALGVSPASPIDLTKKETMAKLILAMSQVEGGAGSLVYNGRPMVWTRVSQILSKKIKNVEDYDSDIPTDVAARVQSRGKTGFDSDIPADLVRTR